MYNGNFENGQNNQQQFGTDVNNQSLQQQPNNGMNNQYGQQQFDNGMNNPYAQQQPANNMSNSYGQQQFDNGINNQYGQQQPVNNMSNPYGDQQFNNPVPTAQPGAMPAPVPTGTNEKAKNKPIIPIIIAIIVVIGLGAAYMLFFNTKTLTCTDSQSYFGIKTTSSITIKFKNNKASSASMRVQYEVPNSYTSEEIEAAKESFAETVEDEDYIINPKVSVEGNVITLDADVKSDKFTSADTYDAAKKELSDQGYTCK